MTYSSETFIPSSHSRLLNIGYGQHRIACLRRTGNANIVKLLLHPAPLSRSYVMRCTQKLHLGTKLNQACRNVPLTYLASSACFIGVLGYLFLWYKHRKNYIWVVNRIFLLAMLNSLAGLLSTLTNVYSAQRGKYSPTAKSTIIVTSVCSVVAAVLLLLYNLVMLRVVKNRHRMEMEGKE